MGGEIIGEERVARPALRSCPHTLRLREATIDDLTVINSIVKSAVRTWMLPHRVLRLSLPSLYYSESDLRHMSAVVVEDGATAAATAVCEPAGETDAPTGLGVLLLHGIYVEPGFQHRGVGRLLVDHAVTTARRLVLEGVAVKAWRGAEGFFAALGFESLDNVDGNVVYPRRMWRPL